MDERRRGRKLGGAQVRLEGAAAEVKATTTANRNKDKFKILDEIREMAAVAKCRDPLRRKALRKSKETEDVYSSRGPTLHPVYLQMSPDIQTLSGLFVLFLIAVQLSSEMRCWAQPML